MPRRYITEVIHQFKGWTGINQRDPSLTLGPKELADCLNFDIGLHGELVKRTGFKQVHNGSVLGANPVHIIGYFSTDAVQQIIARAGSNLYYSGDGLTWTLMPGGPWGNIEYGVQYITKFYMVRRDAVMVSWDGVTASAIAGSPFGSFCRVFKDRLFVVNSYAAGRISSRCYFSNPFDFTSTGWPAVNYVGVSEGDGDILVAVWNVQDHLLIFKSGAIWKLYVQGSDSTAWILRPFSSDVGCVSRDTICQQEGTIYFCSASGVYHSDGNSVKNVSLLVSPWFDQVVVSVTTINNHSAFFWKDKYHLVLETYQTPQTWDAWSTLTWNQLAASTWAGSLGASYTYLVYHTRTNGWTRWQPSGLTPHTFAPVYLNAGIKGVYAGERSASGKIYKYGDNVFQDNNVNYTAMVQTHEEDLAEPGQMKRGKWSLVTVTGLGTVDVTQIVNGQSQAVSTYAVPGSVEEVKLAGPGHFRSWAINLSSSQAGPITLMDIGVALQIGYGERRPIKAAV